MHLDVLIIIYYSLILSHISIMVYIAAATIPVFFSSLHLSYETYSYELYSIVADNSHTSYTLIAVQTFNTGTCHFLALS